MTEQPFVHEFGSPGERYEALAVRAGLNIVPVAIYEGRLCYVANQVRVRGARKEFGWHDRYIVRFLDDDSGASISAGKFNSKAKTPPLLCEGAR